MLGLKGYSYLWLLIIIIIGAFFFAGGQFITEDLDNLGVIPSATPSPTGGPFGGGGGGTTPWNIAITNPQCFSGGTHITIATTVNAIGHIEIQYLSTPPSTYTTTKSDEVTPPSATTDYPLGPGYSTTPWRVLLYEGGTKNSAGEYTPGSGTLKFTSPQQAETNC